MQRGANASFYLRGDTFLECGEALMRILTLSDLLGFSQGIFKFLPAPEQ